MGSSPCRKYDLEAREATQVALKQIESRKRIYGNPTGKIEANWKGLHKIKFHSIDEEEVWVIVQSKISLI